MVGLAVREGGPVATEPLLRRLAHITGPPADALADLVRQPSTASVDRFITTVDDTATEALMATAWVLADADSVGLAQRLARAALATPIPTAHVGVTGYMVGLLLKSGHGSAALALADSALPQSAWQQMQPVIATMPFLPLPPVELNAARRRALTWDSSSPPAGTLAERGRAQMRLYVLGVLSARLGQYDDALEDAARIEHMSAPAGFERVAGNLASSVRATVAFERGDYPLALTLLQRASAAVPLELLPDPITGGERERFLRAQALLQLGRAAEAVPWLENGFQTETGELYRAPCYLSLVEAYEQLGQPEKAKHYYARALAQWAEPDPGLRPQVAAARARLAHLTTERALRR